MTTWYRNQHSNQYVDHIGDNCIAIEHYNDKDVEGYFYDADLNKFYKRCDDKFMVLRVCQGYVNMYDKNKSKFKLSVKKFKIMNGLEEEDDDGQYVSDISDECYIIDHYGKREVEGYFYDADLNIFYKQIENRFKVLHARGDHGEGTITMYDKNKSKFTLAVKKFKAIIKAQIEQDQRDHEVTA